MAARPGEQQQTGFILPDSIRSLAVVEDKTTVLLASISTALHLGTGPVTGQPDTETRSSHQDNTLVT